MLFHDCAMPCINLPAVKIVSFPCKNSLQKSEVRLDYISVSTPCDSNTDLELLGEVVTSPNLLG